MTEESNTNDLLFPQAADEERVESEVKEAGQTQHAWDLLREARESKGVNLVVISSALKVPLNQLKALERGDLDVLPDAVFARALVGSVCRHLGVDSTAILAAWPQAQHNQLQHLVKPVRMTPTPFEGDVKRGVSPWILVGLALVLVVGVAAWWSGNPERLFSGLSPSSAADSDGTTPLGSSQTLEGSAVGAGSPTEGTGIDVGSTPDVAPSVAVAASPAVQTPSAPDAAVGQPDRLSNRSYANDAPATMVPPVAQPALSTEASSTRLNSPAPGTAGLVIRAENIAWVEVRSVDGSILMSRNMEPGTTEYIQDGAPWSIALGNAPETEILRDGKAIDFQAYVRQGIARFNVE